ncbi:unnamed protein product [Mytilus coruscus]|uniref:Novel STAND NTPase 3 domain-containing protein n=1 Tax=Mytilus coruscus TaxID=42192 RepID=A0A6J8BKJ1_MYTCO|nr:unnamed protein product [Mytilus coruscus]
MGRQIQTTVLTFVNAFTSQCPSQTQWNQRARAICTISDIYYCLYDVNKIQYAEACMDGPQFDTPGYKIQIVGNLEGVQCETNRYQPFIFWTNGSDLCKFKKSLCTEEGQTLFSIGTNRADRTCRCDYTKGYVFVVRPKNRCFCMPLEEDCSCFIRHCPSGLVLTPDYKCAQVEDVVANSVCPLTTGIVDQPKTPIQTSEQQDESSRYYNVQFKRRSQILSIVFLILVLLLIGIYPPYLYFTEGTHHITRDRYEKQKLTEDAKRRFISEKEIWEEKLLKFVPTRASLEILSLVTENPFVLVTGPFGSGKTAIAYHISFALAKAGYDILLVSNPEELVAPSHLNEKQLFLIDDIFGKYCNSSDMTDRCEKYCSVINTILTKCAAAKVLITSRTYISQTHRQYFDTMRKKMAYIHTSLISEDLGLCLEERKIMFKSYFKSDPSQSISDNVYLLHNFYPLICSSCNENKFLDICRYPYEVISLEICYMQKQSDICYLALAILVVFNNRIDSDIFSVTNMGEKTERIFMDIFNESSFNQYPSKQLLLKTFMSLNGEFIIKRNETFSFLCTELFDVVTKCIGNSFIHSILKHSSSVFIKEKLELSSTQDNDCPQPIKVPITMEEQLFTRLISDVNNTFLNDVFSNNLFKFQINRKRFLVYLQNQARSTKIVDAINGSNVLHIVSSLGYSDFVNYFLKFDKSVDINKLNSQGKTPLHLACKYGHLSCVELLVTKKAEVNRKDNESRTSLHFGCEAGSEDIVKCLIKNNASIDKKDKEGITPLHIASEKGNYDVVKLLVKNKVKLDESDRCGRTPLHYACKQNRLDIVKFLIMKKADVNKFDRDDFTPLCLAEKCGNVEIVRVLEERTASKKIKNKHKQRPHSTVSQHKRNTSANLSKNKTNI